MESHVGERTEERRHIKSGNIGMGNREMEAASQFALSALCTLLPTRLSAVYGV